MKRARRPGMPFKTLQQRIHLLVALPVETLDRRALQNAMREIGRAP